MSPATLYKSKQICPNQYLKECPNFCSSQANIRFNSISSDHSSQTITRNTASELGITFLFRIRITPLNVTSHVTTQIKQ